MATSLPASPLLPGGKGRQAAGSIHPMSATPREERLAKNEALFRVANERMSRWEERHEGEEAELYYCECANPDCREQLRLLGADYERVRSNSRQFFVAPGH